MTWFAAHAVMYLKLKNQPQAKVLVWENVFLLEAEDSKQAMDKATKRAKEDEGDGSGSLTYDNKPATWVFADVRKLLTVVHRGKNLKSGDEATYSEFLLNDISSVE
ncbi:MAG TPA: DUF4288 domain-containing protein, partial [Burkholderiales bacterium]|nr:DUF4288 domain-containing protein [Burkholderiales bacterium]